MKKVLSLVLALMMCVSAFAFTASAAGHYDYAISLHPVTFDEDAEVFVEDDLDKNGEFNGFIKEANKGDYVIVMVNLDEFVALGEYDYQINFDANTFALVEYGRRDPENGLTMGYYIGEFSSEENVTDEAIAEGWITKVGASATGFKVTDDDFDAYPEYFRVYRLEVITDEVKAVTFELVPNKIGPSDDPGYTWSVNGGVNPTMTVYLNGYTIGGDTCDHADKTTTYTNNGDTHTVTVTCNNPECGKVVSETEEAHTWGEPVVVDSTCDVAGTATYTCTADGCGATKVEDLELAEHGATTKAYANNGETHTVTETCGVCNEVVNTYDEAHTWGAEPVETVESTCAVAGYEVYECTADGCGAQNTVDLPLADHETVLEYTPATTEAAGYVKEYCVVDGCGYVVREEVIEIKTEVFGEAETQDNDAGVKIVAGINKLEVKSAGFIITGKTGLAIDLAVAKADAEQYIVAEATKAYAVVNGWIAEDAFGTGYAMALQLTGLEEFAGKTLYITAYAEGYDGNVEYVDAGSYTIQ